MPKLKYPERLDGVHPDLVKVVRRAAEIGRIDFMVAEGVRTPERQRKLYAQGRTAPGIKVTWTLNSNHFKKADGYGHAVDLLPAPYDWKLEDPKSTPEIDDNFAILASAMFQAAQELGVTLRWGANWDGDKIIREKGESDNPHFELARASAAAAPAAPASTALRQGSKGELVKKLQRLLALNADGDFGQRTHAAVIAFQRGNGLAADGIVGPATWAALEKGK